MSNESFSPNTVAVKSLGQLSWVLGNKNKETFGIELCTPAVHSTDKKSHRIITSRKRESTPVSCIMTETSASL